MLRRFLCWIGSHVLVRQSYRIKGCKHCEYREFLYREGYEFGHWNERWKQYKGPCSVQGFDGDGVYWFDADHPENNYYVCD